MLIRNNWCGVTKHLVSGRWNIEHSKQSGIVINIARIVAQ